MICWVSCAHSREDSTIFHLLDERLIISVSFKCAILSSFHLVHGGWSSWSLSTPCSVTCGRGIEVFTRTCTNPKPQHGGKFCQGSPQKKESCKKKPCPSKLNFVFVSFLITYGNRGSSTLFYTVIGSHAPFLIPS